MAPSAARGWLLSDLDDILPLAQGFDAADAAGDAIEEPLPDPLPPAMAAILADPPDASLDRSERLFELVAECRKAGFTAGQTLSAAAGHGPSREKYGKRLRPETLRCWAKAGAPRPRPKRNGAAGHADPLVDEPWTELGFGRRLIAVYGDRLRYVPEWGQGQWLVWDGARWVRDTRGQAARWQKVIARRQMNIALAEKDEVKKKALVHLARRGESAAGVAGALRLASTEPGIAVSPDQLDADPFLLNCPNGVLDLRTGQLSPHDSALLLTKLTGAPYDADAIGPTFRQFLEEVQPRTEMREFLGRFFGYSLEGRVVAHVLAIFCGPGANGKSTLIGAVLAALGDYGDAADPDLLTARTFESHPTGIADLFGLRLAVLHETDRGRRLAEGTVKRLTGGDRLKARRMREDFWSFPPSHTFVLLTNHKPIVSGRDEGIWRRLRLCPFEVTVAKDKQDDKLPDKLAAEAPAILAWMVVGHRDWQERGFQEPEQVVKATDQYREESDLVRRFLDARCFLGPHHRVVSSQLYSAWVAWCKAQDEDAGSQKAFSQRLIDKGYDTDHTRVGTVWVGIGLAAEEPYRDGPEASP